MSVEPVSNDPLARLAEAQHWVAPLEQPAQDAVHSFFALFGPNAHTIRNLLHGTWLHEPLHAVLVEVPVGAWTATVVFDTLAAAGVRKLNTAADATLVLGLVSALGAAVTGANDWADVKGPARRIGAVHGLLNVAATGLFAAALFGRGRSGSRGRARALAALGYVVVSLSAHLGGNMVYEHGVGVQDTQPLV